VWRSAIRRPRSARYEVDIGFQCNMQTRLTRSRNHQTGTHILRHRISSRSPSLPLPVLLRSSPLRLLDLRLGPRFTDHGEDVEKYRLVLDLLRAVHAARHNPTLDEDEMVSVSISREQPLLGVAVGYRCEQNRYYTRGCVEVPIGCLRRKSSVQLLRRLDRGLHLGVDVAQGSHDATSACG